MDSTRRILKFEGSPRKGGGGFSSMVLPGKNDIEDPPYRWPGKFEPGTLNIRVGNFPLEFNLIFDGDNDLRLFDSGLFGPAIKFPGNLIEGNTILPTEDDPYRGIGQAWNAVLFKNGNSIPCWMFRRIGSNLSVDVELISEEPLRKKYQINNGDPVNLIIYEGR